VTAAGGDEDDGWHFFVMELVDGPDLERAVLDGLLTPADGVRIVRQVGEALEHARGDAGRGFRKARALGTTLYSARTPTRGYKPRARRAKTAEAA